MAVRYDPKYCEQLKKHLEDLLDFDDFAKLLGCDKKTLYRWVEKHQEFALAKKSGTRLADVKKRAAGITKYSGRMKYQPEYCDRLIEHMSKGLSLDSFAGSIGVSVDCIHNWAKEYPDFAEAKKIGFAKMLLFFEEMGLGGQTGEFEKWNASTYIFTMKNKCKWSDNPNPTDNEKKTFTLNYKDE